jgi:hypothetical protein
MEFGSLVIVAVMVLFIAAVVKARRRRTHRSGGPGVGATGFIYELLSEDRRKAIEIIAEERAEARDAETADGNLPELEQPR